MKELEDILNMIGNAAFCSEMFYKNSLDFINWINKNFVWRSGGKRLPESYQTEKAAWLQTVEIIHLIYQGDDKITACIAIQNQPYNQPNLKANQNQPHLDPNTPCIIS